MINICLHFQYSFVASKMLKSVKCVGRLQWLVLNSWDNDGENALRIKCHLINLPF